MEDFFSRFQAILGNNFSKYSDSEVITPLNIVKDMVDLLPADVFNPDAKFLDPAAKSGRFLAEIYRRLFDSPLLSHMNEADRKEHILKNQLYGLATSATAAAVVRKQLYDDAIIAGNVVYTADKVSKELIQGAFENMKFDVVIGNPPYNRGMDIDFVKLGFDLSKQYTVMITPAKWKTASRGQGTQSNTSYGELRDKVENHISTVVFYPDCKDVFDIMQADGISYYLIDKNNTYDECRIVNKLKANQIVNSEVKRSLVNSPTLFNIGDEIIKHLGAYERFVFDFDLDKRYRVLTNNHAPGGALYAFSPKSDKIYIIGKSYLMDSSNGALAYGEKTLPNDATTVFSSDDVNECISFISWLKTRFVRFFVAINISKLAPMLCDECFKLVPYPIVLDTDGNRVFGKFDHIYTDKELYEAFNLPQKYIDVIEAVIKERK